MARTRLISAGVTTRRPSIVPSTSKSRSPVFDGLGIGRGLTLSYLHKTWRGETIVLRSQRRGAVDHSALRAPASSRERGLTPADMGGAQPAPQTSTGSSSLTQGSSTAVPVTGEATEAGNVVRRITIQGNVPLKSRADIFRCFINPGIRFHLKQLRLGIDFEMEMEMSEDQPLDENDPAPKAMKEFARQLGLSLTEE